MILIFIFKHKTLLYVVCVNAYLTSISPVHIYNNDNLTELDPPCIMKCRVNWVTYQGALLVILLLYEVHCLQLDTHLN